VWDRPFSHRTISVALARLFFSATLPRATNYDLLRVPRQPNPAGNPAYVHRWNGGLPKEEGGGDARMLRFEARISRDSDATFLGPDSGVRYHLVRKLAAGVMAS